jgi:hypothetical protein
VSDKVPSIVKRLKCPGMSRNDDRRNLTLHFNRPPTDDEMRFIHECVQRACPRADAK